MTDMRESALNLPLALPHDNVVAIVRHDDGWHETLLPFICGGFAAGSAKDISQNLYGIRVGHFG